MFTRRQWRLGSRECPKVEGLVLVTTRRFPPPWTVEEANNACFVVKDANGFAVSYVYFESEPGWRTAANLLTRDEARRIVSNIVKLPEMVKRPQY